MSGALELSCQASTFGLTASSSHEIKTGAVTNRDLWLQGANQFLICKILAIYETVCMRVFYSVHV